MSTEDKIALLEFENNPNIGLYMIVNEYFALIGCEITKKKQKEIENIVKVPVYRVTALGTDLLGVFFTGNNSTLIIPEIYDYEKKIIEEITNKHNFKLITIENRLNTFGNNLCVLDDSIIVNNNYNKKFLEDIEKKTNLKPIKLKHEEFSAPGAIARFINNKVYLSHELDESHAKEFIDKIGGVGTVNSGSNFISSGVIGNKNGLLLGSQCSTIEIQNILEGFDFL